MAPGLNGFYGSYTTLAMDCKHVIHHSTPSNLEVKLSRPADTYSKPPDWEDRYPPVDFVCISANTFLCPACEEAMRWELREAEEYYNTIWAKGDSRDETGVASFALKHGAWRYRKAALKLANFEARMAARSNSISQAAAIAELEQKWEAQKKVHFDVEEGQGAGEKPKQVKKVRIVMAKPRDSAVELADAWQAFTTSM